MADAPSSPPADGVKEPVPPAAAPTTNADAITRESASPTQSDNTAGPTVEAKPSTSPVVHTLKRPRSSQPVTQFLSPALSTSGIPASSLPTATQNTSPTPPSSTLAVHGSEKSSDESTAAPPKQVRVDGSGSPVTPRSPYANLPRKIPRKTPASTPATSLLGTPTLVSPSRLSPALTTPPQFVSSTVTSGPLTAEAKLAALHQRWAGLLHKALMQERQPHESDAVMALSMRIVAALPGDLEETKDGFQTLLFNMKDVKNGELRRKVVEGELLVERLVRMDDRELANPELRKKIEEKMEDRAKDTNLSELAKAMRTSNSTLFKCKTCGARDTSWYQRQTRSGDEPMTVIITCNKCNTQWRQY
jgi:transcription elongation factor S-II